MEVPTGSEDDFVKAARGAALYPKGRCITKRTIDGLERGRVISLGSVGVDSVDVAAATARGIAVTNVPTSIRGSWDRRSGTSRSGTSRAP